MAILEGYEKQERFITDENKDHKRVSEWTSSDTVMFSDEESLTAKINAINALIEGKLDNSGTSTFEGNFTVEGYFTVYTPDLQNRRTDIGGNSIQGFRNDEFSDLFLNPDGGRVYTRGVFANDKRCVTFETVPTYVYDDDGNPHGNPEDFVSKVLVTSEYQGQIKSSNRILAKDVMSDAQLTDQKVRQIGTNLNSDLRVILSGTADNNTRVEETRKSGDLTFNPSTNKLTVGGVVQATDFVRSSSKYVKENVKDITDTEAKKVLELRPVAFDYINGNDNQRGLIAEEVLEVMPEMVDVPKDYTGFDPKKPLNIPGIDYSKFVPYLIKMIQIQQTEIDELKRR